MKWFEGSIADAIATSRQQKAVFIVYIEFSPDKSDSKSIEMGRLWDVVGNNISNPPLVGVRIYEGTKSAQQFAQIYPVPVVPASYIIDLKGKPLDVITITPEMNETAFLERLKSALKLSSGTELSLSSPGPSQHVGSTSQGICSQISPAGNQAERTSELPSKNSVEEEGWKKEKGNGELKMEVAKTQAQNDEHEIRELAATRRREKREQEAYLSRLREQIKADHEEILDGLVSWTGASTATKAKTVEQPAECKLCTSEGCRIQCKFADGSTLVKTFLANDAFDKLVEVVKQDGRQGSDFYLVQMYPRKEFPDVAKTFAELGLTPSATILVISAPKFALAKHSMSSWIEFIQYVLMAPFQVLYRIILTFIGYDGNTVKNDGTAKRGSRRGERKFQRGALRNREQTGVRQEGNFHRLRDDDDSSLSDDEARWNGNSTQQL